MNAYRLRDARRLAAGTNNWRQAVWNKWLIGYLTPEQSQGSPAEGSEPKRSGTSADDEQKPSTQQTNDPVSSPSTTKQNSSPVSELYPESDTPTEEPEDNRRSLRTRAFRTRLDQLLEQMEEVELIVERVSDRQGALANHQRLQHREFTAILDRLVETQERQTDSIIACTRAMERLERRVMWAERSGRQAFAVDGDLDSLSQYPSQIPPPPQTLVPPSMTQRSHASGGDRPAVEPNTPLNGKLSDLSLPTLLSTAELEMWTGRLTLEVAPRTVQVDLESGLLVGVFEDDSPTDAVEALHTLLENREGRFSFAPSASVMKTELAPLTVGTLLLRASHLHDELDRAGVGS